MPTRTIAFTTGFLLLAGMSALPGCEDAPESFEEAGEQVDDAIEDVGDGIEDAADELDDAIDPGQKGD